MDTKETILSCATSLFANRGYDAVGIQEIVVSAGITKPTLYYHFGSKLGLLEAIADSYFGILIEKVETATAYHGDITSTLSEIMTTIFDFSRDHQDFYRMQLGMNFSPPGNEANQVIRQKNETLFHVIENLFEKSSVDHGNMKGRQSAYAATFIGMINTYIGLALNGYLVLDQNLIVQALHQFMHGIFS